jgi:hypothetical protein
LRNRARALRTFSRSINRWRSLKVRKLIFRNDPLDLLGLALDAVPYPSIGLDGHMLYYGVNRWPFSSGPSLWALGLVANVFIELIGIGHVFTSRLLLLQRGWNASCCFRILTRSRADHFCLWPVR